METLGSLSRRDVLTGLGIASVTVAAGVDANTFGSADYSGAFTVPVDHADPHGDKFTLRYGLLAPFDGRKRTIFVVADGQQFYVTASAFAPSLTPIFDDTCNVVGIFGRADAPEIQAAIGAGSAIDWRLAYRLLKADQWIDDIDAVRCKLLGTDGRIGLYGRSGGAFLAHQYVARRGRYVDRLFTQAAVNPFLGTRFGLASDHFWDELSAADRANLSALLASGRYPRLRLAKLFQRQNFFVSRTNLPQARTALIADLADNQTERIAARETEYQIDALAKLDATPRGPATHVRLFEFYAPRARQNHADELALHPDMEVTAASAAPLTSLLSANAITAPAMDFTALHACSAEVFMVAGRWDHTCDYRTQIALASCYPSGQLALLDDDHVFHRLQSSGQNAALVQAVFHGFSSPEFAAAMKRIEELRWRE